MQQTWKLSLFSTTEWYDDYYSVDYSTKIFKPSTYGLIKCLNLPLKNCIIL